MRMIFDVSHDPSAWYPSVLWQSPMLYCLGDGNHATCMKSGKAFADLRRVPNIAEKYRVLHCEYKILGVSVSPSPHPVTAS